MQNNFENIIGITIIRNESEIINDTLNRMSKFCRGIVVVNDSSIDDTKKICENHHSVIAVVDNVIWSEERIKEQGRLRNLALKKAKEYDPDWLFYFDADERPEIDLKLLETTKFDAIALRLFDFYITPMDVSMDYRSRTKLGPEYRDILMFFRNEKSIFFNKSNREPILPKSFIKIKAGYVKHYGKAISVKEWEETCDYYDKHMRKQYGDKWAKRKGKAIHTKSDFGLPLIEWEEKDEKGVSLNLIEKRYNKIKKNR